MIRSLRSNLHRRARRRHGRHDRRYSRARYYHPGFQRFVSEDPLRITGGYVYAGNDPLRIVDPLGLYDVTAIAGGLVGVALGVGTVATVAAASGAVVGGLPALAVAGGVILGTQVAVTGAVDAITGFMDPVPEIPPITPIGFTVFLLNGNDAKAAKEIEALFSVAKLFTKTAQGLEYALEAIKTGLEIYRSGKESQMPGTPMLPDQRRDAWSQTRILLGGRK